MVEEVVATGEGLMDEWIVEGHSTNLELLEGRASPNVRTCWNMCNREIDM